MSPDEIVDLVDFRYLTDALTPGQARDMLAAAEPGRPDRIERLLAEGYPAYTTSPAGWATTTRSSTGSAGRRWPRASGRSSSRSAPTWPRTGAGWPSRGRPAARTCAIAVDANQRWDVDEAVAWVRGLDDPDLAWVEEPTSPDDVLGHAAIARGIAPIPVATGEHLANRVLTKQFLQAGACSVLQIDATRVAGVNENLANLLLAARFGVRVCPHAGGVGLCEAVQHLAMFDYVALSGTQEGRMIEYVDHLHEHFVDPVRVTDGRYAAPRRPGASTEMHAASLAEYEFRPR